MGYEKLPTINIIFLEKFLDHKGIRKDFFADQLGIHKSQLTRLLKNGVVRTKALENIVKVMKKKYNIQATTILITEKSVKKNGLNL